MNYHNITKSDMLNGEGLRVVLWVAGCNHHCKNCQNPQTHDPNGGISFDVNAKIEVYKELNKPYIQGITFSGGDPLYPANRKEVTKLCKDIKKMFPEKDIWCYTGYKYEQVKALEIMNYIDVLVDGEFVEELKDENYHWAGSTNQRVIRLKDRKVVSMNQKVFYKSYFKNMLRDEIRLWIDKNKEALIGSAIFTKGTTFTANIVAWAEGLRTTNKKGFIPSHTGSIVINNGNVEIFDMKPPRACTQSLEKYIWTTKEDFIILLRDFELDYNMFSKTILDHNGQGYPYMSALRSVLNKRETKWNCHCSELHLRNLQLQGIMTELNAEITPEELLQKML